MSRTQRLSKRGPGAKSRSEVGRTVKYEQDSKTLEKRSRSEVGRTVKYEQDSKTLEKRITVQS
ncbi:hypothetical protein SESBI_49181 [Sesbania bispinosa]|nr:hypothetical protein SESBI_49181 [Sesbania bispinosa]